MPPLYHSASFFFSLFFFSLSLSLVPCIVPIHHRATNSFSLSRLSSQFQNQFVYLWMRIWWLNWMCISVTVPFSLSFFLRYRFYFLYVCFFFLFSLFFDSLLLLFRPNFIHGIDAQSGINNISTIGGSIVSVAMEMANENYFASSFPSFFLHFNSNCDRLLLLNVSLNRWLIGGMEIYRQIVPQIILVSRFIRGNKRGAKTRLDVRFESINSFIPGG